MTIEPFIKCSEISESLSFYTEILDFEIQVPPDSDKNAFMSKYALLQRGESLVHLSSHEGDGAFGSLIYVRVENIEKLFENFVSRGINLDEPDKLPAVTMKLTEQTWGMKEFAVRDPDGNKITFGQKISK